MSAINDEMVVSAEDLKNRREVRADDFRPRGPLQPVVAPEPAPVTPPAPTPPDPTAEALAERRARRRNDPEDVLSLRARRGETTKRAATRGSSAAEVPWYEGPVYVTASSAPGAEASPGSAPPARRMESGPREQLAAAGNSVPAVLTSPLELRGDSATVIAKVEGQTGLLRGARFIGTASASAARVTIHFRALVLADGRQAHIDGEAQDEEGAFGLRPEGKSAAPEEEHGSVLGDVAGETASDVVSAAIGVDVAGRAVDRYLSGSRARRASGAVRPVSLPSGTKLQVFLHEAVELGR